MLNQAPLEVHLALPADAPLIRSLLEHTPRPAVRAWPWEVYLGQETFLIACSRGRAVGALLACTDAGPVAWVRLGVLGRGVGVGEWLDGSLPLLSHPLRRAGARMLAWMDVGHWIGPALEARGFRPLARLVTMVKEIHRLSSFVDGVARLRPAIIDDVAALVRVDHGAFTPPWWLGGETLGRMVEGASCFLVAEWDGRCVGYVEGRLTEVGAHIGRLAVAPRFQGRGIGSLLLSGALSRLWEAGARRVTLNTQEQNRASQRLYIRFGFHPVGRRVTAWGRRV